MNNKQNNFYTSISKYYSEIFPYNPAQLQFVKNRVGDLAGKAILDIGCATGELAFKLAEAGAKVVGIDLNEDLLQQAKSSKTHHNCTFQSGNMLNLAIDFLPAQFDAVLCFGNTLVHLENHMQVKQMFDGVFSVLKPGGSFLLQILNYDYILEEQVSELPLIETESIKFVRKYIFKRKSQHIGFQTELILKDENEIILNETKLLALKSLEFIELLKTTGFKGIEIFSGFNQAQFGGKHIPLVVNCVRG